MALTNRQSKLEQQGAGDGEQRDLEHPLVQQGPVVRLAPAARRRPRRFHWPPEEHRAAQSAPHRVGAPRVVVHADLPAGNGEGGGGHVISLEEKWWQGWKLEVGGGGEGGVWR